MKYRIWKRSIAALAAGLLLLQTPMQTAAAIVSENSIETAAETAASVETETPVEVSEENNTVSDNSLPAQQEEKPEENAAEKLLLNYAYIENAYMEPGQLQNIMVSVGEEDDRLTDARLFLVNTETQEQIVVPVKEITDNTLLFAWDTEGCAKGVYRVEKVSYTYLVSDSGMEAEDEIEFSQVPDMETVCFGVGVENPLSDSEFVEFDVNGEEITAETMSGASGADLSEMLDINVISLDNDVQKENASGEIASAIEEAASSATVPTVKKVAGSTVVIIDPGHDATHAGARANDLVEEDLTLKVANYCKEYLQDNYTDVVVYMTRPGAACPYPGTTSADCNAARVDAAYKVGADVYVSIHFNTTGTASTTATGAIVFYPNSNYNNSVGSSGSVVASKIIEQLEKVGLKNNGIRIRNSEDNTLYPDGSLADYYAVIKRSKLYGFPGVIVEHAFMNNVQDAAFLKSEDNLKKLGVADALGIAAAYNLSQEEVEFDAEDLKVTNIDGANGSFKITLSGATPTDRIANIKFKVYPTADKTKEYLYTAEDKGKGTYSVQGNVSNHGKMEGKYKVIAYAYDAAGKKTQLRSTIFTIKKANPDTSKISLTAKKASTEKTVTLTLKGNEGAAGVSFKVYSKDGGKNDLKTYTAKKNSKGYWTAKVTISKHKSAGDYVAAAYSKSYFGSSKWVAKCIFNIEGPTVRKVSVVKKNLTKGTFQVRAYDVDSASGVKKVQIKVQNLDGKKKTKSYTVKKSKSGYYYADINMKNHNYEYGRYKVYLTVTDKNGIAETVKTTIVNMDKPEPVISAKLLGKQTKISMKASNLGVSSTVKAVRFCVYNTTKTSVKKYYQAKKSKDGTWSASAKISDFGRSGTYKIVTYVKGTNGKYKKTGKAKTVEVATVTGGKVSVSKRSTGGYFIFLGDVKTKSTITKVEVKVWDPNKKSSARTYKASLRSNGKYRATIPELRASTANANFKYQVYVTIKNGIRKSVASGTLAAVQDNAEQNGLYTITGDSMITVNQMVAYYKKYASYPSYYRKTDASTLKKFCQIYYEECEKEGIRAEVAFAQAMKETAFLRFGGSVSISQYNFAGLGATGGGVAGNSFATVRLGVRAHVQHLKAYANSEPLAQSCADPRFSYVQRGCAPYVEWLGIKENPNGKGWAADPTYGKSLRSMIEALKDC